jgi:hypothetical protein
LLEIITLVSSANNIGSEGEFILKGTSFLYTKNNTGPRIEPWRTPSFTIRQSEEEM